MSEKSLIKPFGQETLSRRYEQKAVSYVEQLGLEYSMDENAKEQLQSQIEKHLIECDGDDGCVIRAVEEDVATMIDRGWIMPRY